MTPTVSKDAISALELNAATMASVRRLCQSGSVNATELTAANMAPVELLKAAGVYATRYTVHRDSDEVHTVSLTKAAREEAALELTAATIAPVKLITKATSVLGEGRTIEP